MLKLMTQKYDMLQVLNGSTNWKTQKLLLNRKWGQKVRDDFRTGYRQQLSVIWRFRAIKHATGADDVPGDLNRKRTK